MLARSIFLGLKFRAKAALTNIIFDNYPNSSPDQSAGTPEYQMMGPVRGQEDVASEGLGLLRKGHLTGWKKKLNYHALGICNFTTGH